jgi:TP901 family phage tail tape measure protein
MADIESNIRFGVDTSDAIASIKMLQAQVSAFQRQMASSSVANAESARKLRRGLIDDLNATGQWSASIKTIESSSESFTRSLEKNKLSMGEYFRYAGSQTKTFGGLFRSEFNTIEKVARERVKDLQTQYISLGRDANGALKAISVRPLRLDMESLATQTAMNAQRQQIFNQLLKQGSTNLLNFGKNTQWAGRQLMVGFTIPLSIFGNMASKTFMELEEQAIRFKRVYGELFTPPEEADEMLETLKELGKEFTKYGVAVEKTLGLAADAAAMGKTGTELLDQVTEANRLAVLGNVEQAQALETTISITNAFGVATEDLAKKIDFLNAVENQTVTSIEDLTIAVPKAGPVIQQLGGNVEDLAFFLTAMKEGGINASEGANALKSGLASLINPTDQAANMLKVFGINVKDIVAQSRGDVKKLVIDFATALDELNPSQRAQAIEQLFGKFQFSRLSTLFQNVIQDGTQAQRVLEITNATTQELAQLSNRELKRVEESTTFRFKKAVEEFQLAIAPVGEQFLKLITPIIEFATGIIEKFNGLSDGAKSFITGLTVLFGAIGPIAIMTFGLLANGIANIIKGFTFIRELFMKTGKQSNILGEQLDYMTQEQLTAAAVAASLEQVHQNLIQTFSTEAGAVQRLAEVYRQAFNEQQRFDTGRNIARQAGLRLAKGITSVPGPKGAGDVVPAVLSPGEAVIPAKSAQKNQELIAALVKGPKKSIFEMFMQMISPKRGKQSKKDLKTFQLYEENTPFQLAEGITNVPGPRGAGDIVPALLSPGEAVIPAKAAQKYAPIIQGMIAGNLPGFNKGVFLGMPRSGKSTMKNREAAEQIFEMFKQSSYANVPPTEYGHQLSPTSGHSFPIFGLGGVYMGPNGKKVFVKPVMDEKAALAEMRATEIARKVHGLKAPEQRIVVIRDPQDPTRQRRFLALESALDASFVNDKPMGIFNEDQYFKQLVASLLRVDKDLSASNVFGDTVADVGPAGVFSRASGLRDYAENLPSMEQQAMVNLLGIKGGAKRAFAEATVGLMAGLTPEQYHQRMIGEIQKAIPLLEQTVAGFKLSNPQEARAYTDMIARLRQGLTVDWSKFHAIHSAVKPSKPKQSNAIPGYENGVVSVPGPRGAGDIQPAMLSPGEAVIPAKMAKKYAPLIQAMISGSIPGFEDGLLGAANVKYQKEIAAFPGLGDAIETLTTELLSTSKELSQSQALKELEQQLKPLIKMIRTTVAFNEDRGPSGTSNTGVNAAHGNARKILTPEEANMIGQRMIEKGYRGGTAQALASATAPVQAYSNLTFPMPRAFNTGDMSGIAGAEWIKEMPDRFISMIAKNAKMDPNSPGLIEFAENVSRALEEVGSTAVSESMFEEIIGQQIEQLAEGAAKQALIEARDTYQTFNVVRPGSSQPRREAAQTGTGINAQGEVLEGSQQRSYRAGIFRKLIKEFNDDANAFVIQIADGMVKAIKDGLRIQSPSKEFEEIANGVSAGVRQGKDDAVRAGAEVGEAVADGAAATTGRTPRRASSPQTDLSKIPGGRQSEKIPNNTPRRASALGTKEQRELEEAKKAEAAAAQNVAVANEDVAKKSQSASDRLDRMNSMLMQGTFALTSLAGVGVLAGGAIGDVSQKIFEMSGIFFALMQVTQLLTQAKILELAQSRIKIASDALETASKAGAFAATNLLTGGMIRAGIAVNAFLGPVGWVILGLTALAGVIALIIGAQQEQQKKINGLGDAAFLTSEKMKKAGQLLGFDPKTTAFGQNIKAGTAAARGSEEASMINQLRSDEGFKTDFATEIDAIRNATKGQAEAALQSVSNQLFAAGASQEQVDAYVRAIAQEAERTDLSFSFAKIDFSKDGAQQIANTAREASKQYADTFNSNVKVYFDKNGNLLPEMTDYGKEGLKGVQTFAGAMASSFQSLKDGLANGLITADQFKVGLAGVSESLQGLSAGQLKLVLPQLYKDLGLEETMKGIPLIQDQLLLLQADAAGIEIPETDVNALKNADKSAKAASVALRVRTKIKEQVAKQATEQEKLNKAAQEEALINEQIGAANAQLSDRVVQLENQRAAYDILIEQGYTAAQAFDLAGDAGLAAGIKAAYGANGASQDWKDLKAQLDAVIKLEKNAPKSPTSGGAGDKSPYEEAIDSLKEQRKELIENATAFSKLRKAGFDTASAMRAAEDPILAAALATTKVGTQKWNELISKIKETQRLLTKKEMQDLLRGGKVEIAERRAQATVANALTTLGYTAEQIDEVLSDQEFTNTLAADLKDGKINAKEVFQRLAQIKQLGKIDIDIAFATKEGAAEEFQKRYDKVVGYLEAQKQVIEVDFQVNTFDDSVIVRKAEEQIADINEKIDNQEAQLAGIEEQEGVINEAYDERKKALDEVAKANDVIARQQKNQLTLADALSQGDIAAAAKAAQDMRAQSAQDSIAKQGDQLELARQQQLNNLRSKDGRSRQQIEQEIKDLKKQIFIIEEETLEPARERIREAEVEKNLKLDSLNQQILKWDQLAAKVNEAKLRLTPEEMAAMEYQAGLIADLLDNWNNIEDKTAILTIIKKTIGGDEPPKEDTNNNNNQNNNQPDTNGGGNGGNGGNNGATDKDDKKPVVSDQKASADAFKASGMSVSGFVKKTDSAAAAAAAAAKAAQIAADKAKSTAAFTASGMNVAAFSRVADAQNATKNSIAAGKAAAATIVSGLNSSKNFSGTMSLSQAAFEGSGQSLSAYIRNKAMGGMIKRYAAGGFALGTDIVPAMLTPGEFVVRKYAVDNFGVDNLKAINSGTYKGDSVYNYEVNVNVQTNSNPDQIAASVIGKIKQIDSQRIRGNRF